MAISSDKNHEKKITFNDLYILIKEPLQTSKENDLVLCQIDPQHYVLNKLLRQESINIM